MIAHNTVNSGAEGIYYEGSQLTVGTTEQLPTTQTLIANNRIDSAATASIHVKGNSFDSSENGYQIHIEGNQITNNSNSTSTTGIRPASS